MGRTRRKHRLEPVEHLTLEKKVHGIADTVGQIYGLIVERFGRSDKKAQRLRALDRKLTEVIALLAEQATVDMAPHAQRSTRFDPAKAASEPRGFRQGYSQQPSQLRQCAVPIVGTGF